MDKLKETAAWLKAEKPSQTSFTFQLKVSFSPKLIYYSPIVPSSFSSFHKKIRNIQILLLLNFATACFNAGATCALHRNLSWNLGRRGKSQDCSPSKTGFSASSEQCSHSKLLKSRGPLKDKAAWQSLEFSFLPHSFVLKSCLLFCFFPFGYNFYTPAT